MKPFFTSVEAQNRLLHHAARWVGTPFVAHGSVCQAGVDCVHLCAAIYIETGVMKDFNPGKYSVDSGQHNSLSQVLSWLAKSDQFVAVNDMAAPLAGDLLVMNVGRVEHHVALMLPSNTFVHALRGRGVVISSFNDSGFARRITAVYRPVI